MPMPVSLTVSVDFSSSSSRSMRGSKEQGLVQVVGQRQVLQLVERVGRIGDQLAEKDLRVRVKRVDDQLKQLIDFCLKFKFCHEFPILQGR